MHAQYGFDSTTRWHQMWRLYDEFAITGYKVQWIPNSVVGSYSPNETMPEAITTWEDLDNPIDRRVNELTGLARSDYRSLQWHRPFAKYYSNRYEAKKAHMNWLKTDLSTYDDLGVPAPFSSRIFRFKYKNAQPPVGQNPPS